MYPHFAKILTLIAFLCLTGCKAQIEPGIVAPEEPVQINLEKQSVIHHKEYRLLPLATFSVTARVLGKERYRFDRGAGLAPFDLALGWGKMSDVSVTEPLQINQAVRRVRLWWDLEDLKIPRRELEMSSSNMHIVPATDEVKRTLKKISSGDVITFSGYLVEARDDGGFQWRSSMSREDRGDGACELVYVEELTILE